MSNSAQSTSQQMSQTFLTSLSSRLTIGSAVCFSEGISASIMMMVPQDERFLPATVLLTFIIWAAFWTFRENKLGADIGDLCFYDLVLQCSAFICDRNGINADAFWYGYAAISCLKLIRVYLWQTSSTQLQGWGKFGPMTYYHAKYHEARQAIAPYSRLQREIVLAFIVAAIGSVLIRLLPDLGRVAVTWIVPLSFEFLYGPMQLRKLKVFNNLLSASAAREAELTTENQRLKQEIEAQNRLNNLPEDQNALIQAYAVLPPEKQQGLMEWAQLLSKNFGKSDK
jgi:uncharacterized membrane protein YedE/YeeE